MRTYGVPRLMQIQLLPVRLDEFPLCKLREEERKRGKGENPFFESFPYLQVQIISPKRYPAIKWLLSQAFSLYIPSRYLSLSLLSPALPLSLSIPPSPSISLCISISLSHFFPLYISLYLYVSLSLSPSLFFFSW